jgi:hypothetical protein
VYELDADARAHGAELRRQNMQMIADCRAINEWPGYGIGIESLSLPSWALRPDTSTITSDDF